MSETTDEKERQPRGVPDDGLQVNAVVEKKWRLLKGSSLLPDAIQGIKFVEGVRETKTDA